MIDSVPRRGSSGRHRGSCAARLRRLAPLLLPLFFAGCAADTSVEGVVRGKDGRAIRGAMIMLQDHSRIARFQTSDAQGVFHVKIQRQPGWRYPLTMSISARGFQPFETEFRDAGLFRCAVVLSPADGAGAKPVPVKPEQTCVPG